ncbi:hypothetical protein HGRIS_003776 [Hohenbuehelia grisea]|uniref:Uncharacterized protein n=1 Tax=Hohenbuehelia grisea TaxID=104357 RepID=A0ABR3JH29_9AGAR
MGFRPPKSLVDADTTSHGNRHPSGACHTRARHKYMWRDATVFLGLSGRPFCTDFFDSPAFCAARSISSVLLGSCSRGFLDWPTGEMHRIHTFTRLVGLVGPPAGHCWLHISLFGTHMTSLRTRLRYPNRALSPCLRQASRSGCSSGLAKLLLFLCYRQPCHFELISILWLAASRSICSGEVYAFFAPGLCRSIHKSLENPRLKAIKNHRNVPRSPISRICSSSTAATRTIADRVVRLIDYYCRLLIFWLRVWLNYQKWPGTKAIVLLSVA